MPRVEAIRASQITITEANYVKETLRGLWEELPILLSGALGVTLAGLPAGLWLRNGAVLLAAATSALLLAPLWTGYCYLLGRNALGEKPSLADLLPATRHFYIRSLLSTLPLVILTPPVFYFTPGLRLDLPLFVVVGIVAQIIIYAFVVLLLLFVFPLLALFDLTLAQAWKNSLYLLARWPWVAVGLASLGILLVLAAGWAGIGFLPLIPLLLGAFAVNAVLMLVRRLTVESE